MMHQLIMPIRLRWYLVNLAVELEGTPPFTMVTFLSFPDHKVSPTLTAEGIDMFHEDYMGLRVLTMTPALCEGKEFDDEPTQNSPI